MCVPVTRVYPARGCVPVLHLSKTTSSTRPSASASPVPVPPIQAGATPLSPPGWPGVSPFPTVCHPSHRATLVSLCCPPGRVPAPGQPCAAHPPGPLAEAASARLCRTGAAAAPTAHPAGPAGTWGLSQGQQHLPPAQGLPRASRAPAVPQQNTASLEPGEQS